MDGLARAFLAKPVLFLQYETDSPHALYRHNRFMAAWDLDRSARETSADTPHTMVDSGQAISYGERDYQREYRGMIDGEIPRPPTALLHARRSMPAPGTLEVEVQATNLSTATLETANEAMLHVVLFDGTKALKTGNDILATRQVTFDEPLRPGQTRRFAFTFDNIRGVNLTRADAIAMLDYRPPWSDGRWDMMQAAIAVSRDLPELPTPVVTATTYATRTRSPSATPTPSSTPTQPPTPTREPSPVPGNRALFVPFVADGARLQR